MKKHWSSIAFYGSILLLVMAMGWYSAHSQQENNKKWCKILVAMDKSPMQNSQFHALIHRQAVDFRCY